MARLSRFTTKARRRAGRQHAVAVAAVVGPSAVDLTQAVVEQVGDLGWRVSVDSKTLACGLASREAAEAYLANLERIRTTPMANDELDRLRGDVAGTKTKDAGVDPRVAELRAEIADIVKLAHSRDPDDEAEYRERQPELRDLTARLIEAEQGDLADAVIEKVGTEWKIRAGKNLLEWSFGDRAMAAKFLEQLKQQKDDTSEQ